MKFSQRVKGIDISGIRRMFEAAPPEAINLGLGQPDFDTPEHIKKAAIVAINQGFTGYTANLGIPELRLAIRDKFVRENNFGPEEVIVTSGASEALHLALQTLVEEGDEVLMPDPGFVSYAALTRLAGGKVVGVPLGSRLTLEPGVVKEYITPRTKAIIINSPSNPTGGVQSRWEIKALAEIAADHGIPLISDEVYEHFIYEGEHVSPACYNENVITVNAVSKTYAMTGWRLGYAAAPKEYVEEMLKVHQYIQACANSIAQKAALAALTGPQDSVALMRDEFKMRRKILLEGLSSLGIRCAEPKGAFYAFPEIEDDVESAQRLLEKGVIVVPGTSFGAMGKDHIRISYAAPIEKIEKALKIMEKVLLA